MRVRVPVLSLDTTRVSNFQRSDIAKFFHALAADALLSFAAAELASDPAAVLRLTTAIPPVSLEDS